MSNTFNGSDDGDEAVCPLCCEAMDLSDQNFLPCPCGYRVCMWCWHRIKENYTNLCPACRSQYSDDPHAFAAVDKEEVIKNENSKKKRAKQKDSDQTSSAAAATAAREHQHALHLRHHHQHQQHIQHLHREQMQLQQGGRGGGGGAGGSNSVASRRELANMRVVQRNLVYVTGLPSGLDSEEVLRRPENFGQYGRIYKIAISISQSQASEQRQGNVSAHITFAFKEDALACILATDGFWLEGRQLRSNFGTTKYCATYLRNSPCANPECLYLHELGSEEDRFSKEEIQQRSLLAPPIPSGAVTVTGAGGPSGTGKRCTSPFLPPPVYESLENSGSSGAGGGGGGSTITMRGLPQQVQQTSAAAHRGVGRGAKPAGQSAAATNASKPATSVGVAWGGAGAVNGASSQPIGDRSAVGVVMGRGKGGALGAASPTASPHLQAHDPARLQEEWPSLADTAGPAPAPASTPAAQSTGRTSRNRRKKEKQQQQQLLQQQSQEERVGSASPSAPPISSPKEPTLPSPPAPAAPAPSQPPAQAAQSSPPKPPVSSQPPLSQPPGLGPVIGNAALPQAPAAISTGSPDQGDVAVRARPPFRQEALSRTTSTSSTDASSSMFSTPFFSNGGGGSSGGSGSVAADAPGATTTAPAPPGFSEIPFSSLASPSLPRASSSSPSTVASSSPPQTGAATATASSPVTVALQQPARSRFKEHFNSSDGVFNGGMFSSSAIGGGLFADGAGAGITASPSATAGAGGSSPAAAALVLADAGQGLLSDRASPGQREFQQLPSEEPELASNASIASLLDRPTKGLGMGLDDGGNDLSFNPLPTETAGPSNFGLGRTPSTSTPVAASPFGATFGGGHFGGAFGSALFPVSTHRSGVSHGTSGLGDTDGQGADLSVDPFANSSGALAAMLGVTLPPVDSHSSLASKMRSVLGEPHSHTAALGTSPVRSHFPPRGGNAYSEFSRDMGPGREGRVHSKGEARDLVGGERGGGPQNDYRRNQQVGGTPQENQASRFSFAQDDNPSLPFSPARGSPQMGQDPRGSPGGMGSPPVHGQHHHQIHHHQSHAHRPFPAGPPLTPPQLAEYTGGGGEGQFAPPLHHHHLHHNQHHFQQHQQQRPPPQQQPQQQYSIQNGMAFLQKVLPGVSLSYGDRHPPAGAGGGQGQPQGPGASGVPPSGGVGWGDNAAGQRVDPAQAFGSTLWTMAPTPNAPRQPQGSRGGGYGAW